MIDKLTDAYEEILLIHDPLTELLNKGDLNSFLEWFNIWKPSTTEEELQLKEIINNKIIPKLIEYEYYEWIKLIK